MYRTATAVFAAALLVLIAGFALLYGNTSDAVTAGLQIWGPQHGRVVVGKETGRDDAITMEFDDAGRAVYEVEGRELALRDLPLLHLAFAEQSDAMALIIGWRTQAGGKQVYYRRVGVAPGRSFWLDMSGETRWSGNASTLAVIFLGPPGGRVALDALQLAPNRFPYSLYTRIAGWTTFVPWSHSSINAHLGVVTPGEAPYPVLVAVGLLAIALALYVVWVFLLRQGTFRWAVPGILLFIVWIGLDSLWQGRLLRQAEVTWKNLAGQTTVQKRANGVDRELYRFVQTVDQALGERDGRVFVSSSSDYFGMRAAYYLYPRNVYWKRHAKTLPEAGYLRPDDYVVLLEPFTERFNADAGELLYNDQRLSVRRVFSARIGALYEVTE